MEEPPASSVSSIKSRIAALNLEEVHAPAPGTRPAYRYEQAAPKKKPPPPPPPSQRPPPQQRHQTVNNPPIFSNAPTSVRQPGNQPIAAKPDTPKIQPALPPRLPPRTSSTSSQQAPVLPPRKSPENSIKRRDSTESVSTIASGRSTWSVGSAKTNLSGASGNASLHQVRAPLYDPSKLPPLPPKKAPDEPTPIRAALKSTKSSPNVVPDRKLPPILPSRPPLPARQDSTSQEHAQPNKAQIILPPRRPALSFGLNKSTEGPPPTSANRPLEHGTPAPGPPPPIPLASRPNLDQIMASKPKPSATTSCLKCRDFSGPDNHAAQYSRQNLPSSDVTWLATQLTSPFPSLTDKARAIFTWLHHNVEYDTHSYFGGTISGTTPERTITTGLAVCDGYAGLFATLALKSGLESVKISGHGKGYGHHPLDPGASIPQYSMNHAWNAVRIDNGEWKLIDACWGAGNVKGPSDPYEKCFKPQWFTMDNNEFGCSHFPPDNSQLFRTDVRAFTWEDYMLEDVGERLTVYTPATTDHGLGERTFQPAAKHIKLYDPQSGPTIRFSFASVCPHWDNEKHGKGKPYVMVLHIGGRDGRKTDWVPFQTDGKVFWLDVNRTDLGAPGQKVSVFAVTSFNGRDGRGLSYPEFKSKKGKTAMGFGGVAMWELV
ncbi:uncharacterized protein BDR25DRAFT_287718 [Lindgomyces ingoldianus]|uniref:Uncharacterized protein n=1 Tax=Lindgomyces ingoldianus TaxID=673940 RepID=A0ACB6QSU7_9PLEO|nr:uncharacterized protein BDR25DRAFT_287718 [Lindgomyces ingoldianus]KAF2470068.1 hypothetical protein BDR25DRAFT_287718 [Lindgomyces ingoldianus]